MALTAEQSARLSDIETILGEGISEVVSNAGRRIVYNLSALRRERDELRQLATASRLGSRFRRVILTDG